MVRTHKWYPIDQNAVSREDFIKLDKESQKQIMRKWFFDNFENPVERCPYESREGGYFYIWGGPYNATEELDSEFSDVVEENVINELADELNEDCFDWSGKPSASDYDDYLIDMISSNTKYHATFTKNMTAIRELLKTKIQRGLKSKFYNLLYANIITAVETYLFDAFVNRVLKDKDNLKTFVSTTKEFQERKLSVSEIFERYKNIQKEVEDFLLTVMWHNLARVRTLYKSTLKVDFPEDIGEIYKAILVRHDIVHRNGRDKEGKKITITFKNITDLIDLTLKFISHIDGEISKQEKKN